MSTEKNNYYPFSRGSFPVGVRSQDLYHKMRKRTIPIEIWYPTTDEFKGKDLLEESKDKFTLLEEFYTQDAVRDAKLRKGAFPLIIYSHGHGAHRRLVSNFCCHLASHGYIVVSPDHIGNTITDMMGFVNKTEQEMMAIGAQAFYNRPKDIQFILNSILKNKTLIPSDSIDIEHIGLTGYSFGGWTILMVASNDERISVALPMASAGGAFEDHNRENPFYDALSLDWSHKVSTLYLAAENDTLVPISTIYDLFHRTHEPKSMVILKNADHFHFCQEVKQIYDLALPQLEILFGDTPETKRIKENFLPFSESCPPEKAHDFMLGLGLAHMDAYLKKKSGAAEWLAGDIKAHMADRGVDVKVVKNSD